MNFSNEWNDQYINGRQLSIWPWTDLISYVKRHVNLTKSPLRVLEIGCGAGANIPFFQSLQAEYYAIEGSSFIVSQLKERFALYSENIKCGDFTTEIPFDVQFDLIVDRSALTHNTTKSIIQCLKILSSHLIPNGIFIGIDWFSTEHSDYIFGEISDDKYTKKNIQEGQFKQLGNVHFSDAEHINNLFSPSFSIEKLEHKVITSYPVTQNIRFASWNLLARRLSDENNSGNRSPS